jgi:hypothetical protein
VSTLPKCAYSDYKLNYLLKEDSLKNAFYHHLRNNPGDSFLNNNNIRIYTEYYLDNLERTDIAIVRLLLESEFPNYDYHLRDLVKEVLAIIELKHKNGTCGPEPFLRDISKIYRYCRLRKYEQCQCFLGFIYEKIQLWILG